MKVSEIIAESPQLIPPVKFDVADEGKNRALAQKLLKKNKETIEETENYIFFRTGDGINGYYVLYNKDRNVIGYLIKYTAIHNRLIGSNTVTQVVLWRRSDIPYVSGLTKKVFFEILLPRYGAIMSDSHQTENGKEFWVGRLTDASIGPYDLGLVDFKKQSMNWWDRTVPFHEWLETSDGWGKSGKFQDLRYVIKKKGA